MFADKVYTAPLLGKAFKPYFHKPTYGRVILQNKKQEI